MAAEREDVDYAGLDMVVAGIKSRVCTTNVVLTWWRGPRKKRMVQTRSGSFSLPWRRTEVERRISKQQP
jgi:hypothetical protein